MSLVVRMLTTNTAAIALCCVCAVSSSYHGAKGGDISIDAPGQHVIERSSVMVLEDGTVEARFNINLPARGRSICGDWAHTILVETLPKLVERALVLNSLDGDHLWAHIRSVEDQEELRGLLKGAGLVGFIRDGAVLPREVRNRKEDMHTRAASIADRNTNLHHPFVRRTTIVWSVRFAP